MLKSFGSLPFRCDDDTVYGSDAPLPPSAPVPPALPVAKP
jgi:hypothetical protein